MATIEHHYHSLIEALTSLTAATIKTGKILLWLHSKSGNRHLVPIMNNLADVLVSIDQARQQAEKLVPPISGYLPPPEERYKEDEQWVEKKTNVSYLTLLTREDD
jgi:hypothetical protein